MYKTILYKYKMILYKYETVLYMYKMVLYKYEMILYMYKMIPYLYGMPSYRPWMMASGSPAPSSGKRKQNGPGRTSESGHACPFGASVKCPLSDNPPGPLPFRL
jgi:hypothetical protein